MTKSLEIAKSINALLDNKVYNIIANHNARVPYMVFKRDSISPTGKSKDGVYEETVTYTVIMVDDNYERNIETASNVRNCLELVGNTIAAKARLESLGYPVLIDTYLTGAREQFNEGEFIQELSFSSKIRN